MNDSEMVVAKLNVLLASSYTLYLKTHNYHWNVTGPMFTTLHTLFELQYMELATSIDEIAERIRTLDARAPGSYSEYVKMSVVREDTASPQATDMIAILVADQQLVVETAREVIRMASMLDDDASADLATRRVDVHEKNAWMLRSHLA